MAPAQPTNGPGPNTGGERLVIACELLTALGGVSAKDEAADLSPAQRALRARIAAHASWAKTEDREARTRAGSAAFMARFEREVDPDGTLEPAERLRRAQSAKAAYFQRLALSSSRARRRASASD